MSRSSTHPFEDESARYRVLLNARGQYSLWPARLAVPAGWDCVHGPDARAACVAHIDAHWTDLAPTGPARTAPEGETVS
ncbi:MbtH family protein [Streptomyces galbus]|uniref:MbtH family protein n=1 Tax=Streptomyces galbus TaxID=33898 RepID=A0A4U5XAW6_STRGB|nr:MbtH family protein [Streptomyces galbus]TKT10746.1 MbtH family protein [Streptomyces galbus]GHD20939.1 protein MbtH [Streptomyces galbus]